MTRTRSMTSRRLLRIKVLQALYAWHKSGGGELDKAEQELFRSIEKSRELFYYLIDVVLGLVSYAGHRIELAKDKKRPSQEDLDPNLRFVENRIIGAIHRNRSFKKNLEGYISNWDHYEPEKREDGPHYNRLHTPLVKQLYTLLTESAEYQDYMQARENNLNTDLGIICHILNELLANEDSFAQQLESMSIAWNDELEYVIGKVCQVLREVHEIGPLRDFVPPVINDEDDRFFVRELFRKAVSNEQKHLEIIHAHTKNWEHDRIAFMDMLLMQLAVTELINFPEIPENVSLNEYIEISKYYSTERSATFINGVLDKAIDSMKESGEIKKTGKGLIKKTKQDRKA